MQNLSILCDIEIGSRIYVECNDNLWKATVKKVLPDVVSPKLKIHYDGKKKHLIDTISFDMVKCFIEGENEAFDYHKRAKSESQSRLNGSQETLGRHCQHVSGIFPLLPTLYPAILPPGESEVLQDCPELGTGWKINLIRRKMKSGGTRIDRYFISPTGRKLQGVLSLVFCQLIRILFLRLQGMLKMNGSLTWHDKAHHHLNLNRHFMSRVVQESVI
jgi:hypothetical protein